MELNKDQTQRDKILKPFYDKSNEEFLGGCKRFNKVPLKILKKLLEEKFLDPEDKHNDAHAVEEFIEFMRGQPGITAMGYAISADRDDYRISIDGIETDNPSADFNEFCCGADELTDTYAWWD